MKLFVIFACVVIVSTQTTPTPISFDGNKDEIGDNDIDGSVASDDADVDSVLYVDRTYDDMSDADADVGEPMSDPVTYDADRYPNFGGFSSAELYRLLALGPKQTDPEMSFRLGGLLGRMNAKTQAPYDNIDHCPDRPEIGIQYYCMKLEDGLYFDPWNPWCGFIRCNGGVAERVCCTQGTWLGPLVMLNLLYQPNQKELCRRPLSANIQDAQCPMPSTKDICQTAKKVEQMNPPKQKSDVPYSQGELKHFSRLQSGFVYSDDDRDTS